MQTPPKWKALGLPILAYHAMRRQYDVTLRDYREMGTVLHLASGSQSTYFHTSPDLLRDLDKFIDHGASFEGSLFRKKVKSDPESGDLIFYADDDTPFLECVYVPWEKYLGFCEANQVSVYLGYSGAQIRLPGQEGHADGNMDVGADGRLRFVDGMLRGLIVPTRIRRVDKELLAATRPILAIFGITPRVNGSGSWSVKSGLAEGASLLLKGAEWKELVVRAPEVWGVSEVPF